MKIKNIVERLDKLLEEASSVEDSAHELQININILRRDIERYKIT